MPGALIADKKGKQMKNKASFAIKAAVIVAVTAGVVTSGFEIRETKATLTAPSGKCGALLTANNAGLTSRLSTWNDVGTSTLALFDFDAGKVTYDGVDVTNFGNANAASTSSSGDSTFTMTAQNDFAGHYLLTFPSGGQFNIVSTNGGNTILMSEVSTSNTSNANLQAGICQAL